MYKLTMCHDVLMIISQAANRPSIRAPIHPQWRKRKKGRKIRTRPDQTCKDEKIVKRWNADEGIKLESEAKRNLNEEKKNYCAP